MAKYENTFLSNCIERDKHEDVGNVFKLRNMLYDKISNLTRSNKLQKGESVEITLEIELIKPQSSNSINSLVEVTIIEHNRCDMNVKDLNKQKKPVHLPEKWKEIESASQKRRNWFQRVISGHNKGDHVNNPTYNTYRVCGNECKMEGNCTSHCIKENNGFPQSTHFRSNFINVLPEDIVTSSGDYRASYKRVSTKNTPRTTLSPRPRNILTATRKPSLVKVISDLFLPSKKTEKNQAVKSVLNALKHEVDNIHVEGKPKSTKKKPKPPVHNLGKLVSNILVDMMEQSSIESSEEIKNNSYPIQYQSFFEPVKKANQKTAKKHRRKTNASKINAPKQGVESHSTTWCIDPKNPSKLEVKPFAYKNNNRTLVEHKKGESEFVFKNEIQNEFSKKKSKLSYNKSAKKHGNTKRCYAKLKSTNNIPNKASKHIQTNSTISPKKSSIQWNGERIVVNKEIKKKIEMLIVNELQNLALIEGMECDIKSLPPVGTAMDSTASNISSFLCELDVNDPIFSREKTKRMNDECSGICHPTSTIYGEINALQQGDKNDRTQIEKDYNEETEKLADSNNALHLNTNSDILEKYNLENNKDNNHKSFNDTISNIPDTGLLDGNDIKVTYLNDNINNWSADSKTAILKSPIPIRQNLKCKRKYLNSLQPYDFKKHMKNKINSDFVKVIESDDSTLNNNLKETKLENENLILQASNYAETIGGSETAKTFIYKTSNECESTIEIELNVHDLELILQKAKEKHNADKILISAKCNHELQKEKKHLESRGKNSQSYTDYLLYSAAKKLKE